MSAAKSLTLFLSEIGTELQDSGGNYFTTALKTQRVNEAINKWVAITRNRRKTTTMNVTAEVAEYALTSVSPPVLEVLRVALPSSEGATDEIELIHKSLQEIEDLDKDWRNTTGQPWAYMRWGQGWTKIRLYPTPSTSFSTYALSGGQIIFKTTGYGIPYRMTGVGDTTFNTQYGSLYAAEAKYGGLRVDYVAASTDLSDNADTPLSINEIPVEHHDTIKKGAKALLLMDETELQQFAKGEKWWNEFLADAVKARTVVERDFQRTPNKHVRLAR